MSAYDDILGALPMDQLASEVGAAPDEVARATEAVLPALLGGLEANAQDGGSMSILQALGQHDPGLLDGGIDLSQIDTTDGAAIASHIFGDNEDMVVSQLGGMQLGAGGGIGSSLIRKLIPILAPIVLSYIANKVLGRMGGGSSSGGSGGDASGGSGGGASGGSGGGGGLGDILGQILGGGQSSGGQADTSPSLPTPTGSGSAGADSSGTGSGGPGSLDDLLKDVLGSASGSRSSGGQSSSSSEQQGQGSGGSGSIITDILGGLLGGGRR